MTLPVSMDDPGSLWPVPEGLKLLLPSSQDVLWALVAVVVIYVVVRFLWIPRFDALLRSRSDATEGAEGNAQDLRREAQEALDARNAILADARVEANTIRQQAALDGARATEHVRVEASAKAEALVAEAQEQIETERDLAVRALRTEVGALALDLASSVLGERIDDTVTAAVVETFLESVRRDEEQGTTPRP